MKTRDPFRSYIDNILMPDAYFDSVMLKCHDQGDIKIMAGKIIIYGTGT